MSTLENNNVSSAYANLTPGDPAPWFHQRSTSNPRYAFDTIAGRYVLLCFFASAADPVARAALNAVLAARNLFDDQRASFFGVSLDPTDERERRIDESLPGLRYFWDFDGTISRRYGVIPRDAGGTLQPTDIRRCWVVLDPTLRVLAVFPFANNAAAVLRYVQGLPESARFAGPELQAPVLFLPNVFEPDFCRTLIDVYGKNGGTESGFMREIDGKTVMVNDHYHKRRKDYVIDDQELVAATRIRILRRIVPEIAKVHQFKVTRMERYIVSCYAAEDRAHFRAHRDNTTKGTSVRCKCANASSAVDRSSCC